MAGTGVIKTKTLLLRGANRVGRRLMSKVSGIGQADKAQKPENLSSCWVPHPRTGIYFPQGHERVMEDIPSGAASFGRSHWLRAIDGVDKPESSDRLENNAMVCIEKKLK